MRTRTATCACGQLRAIREGEPPRVVLCDCTQCQKRTGSVYGVAGYFGREQVRTEGAFKRYRRSSDAGRYMDCAFCPECGSTVFWELEVLPDRIGVAAGAFADPGFPAPHLAVWTENKYHWVPLPEDVPTRPKQT
jgi:hypothetical protein